MDKKINYKINTIDNLFSEENIPDWLISAIHQTIIKNSPLKE